MCTHSRLIISGTGSDPELLVGTRDGLYSANRTKVSRLDIETKYVLTVNVWHEEGLILWTGPDGIINSYSLSGKIKASVVVANASSVAVDWISGKVYWDDWDSVRVMDFTTKRQATLLHEGIGASRGFVLDPGQG